MVSVMEGKWVQGPGAGAGGYRGVRLASARQLCGHQPLAVPQECQNSATASFLVATVDGAGTTSAQENEEDASNTNRDYRCGGHRRSIYEREEEKISEWFELCVRIKYTEHAQTNTRARTRTHAHTRESLETASKAFPRLPPKISQKYGQKHTKSSKFTKTSFRNVPKNDPETTCFFYSIQSGVVVFSVFPILKTIFFFSKNGIYIQ